MLKKISTALSLIALLAGMAVGIMGCEEGAPIADTPKTEEIVEGADTGPAPTQNPEVGSGTIGAPETKPDGEAATGDTAEVTPPPGTEFVEPACAKEGEPPAPVSGCCEGSPTQNPDTQKVVCMKAQPPAPTDDDIVVKPFGWLFEKPLWAVLTKDLQSSRVLLTKDDLKQFYYPYIQIVGSPQKPLLTCNTGLKTAMFQKIEDSKDPCFLDGLTCWISVILFENNFSSETECSLKVGDHFEQKITVKSGKTYSPTL